MTRNGQWRRRDVVQLAMAGGAALAVAGCAQPTRRAAAQVVVVGGGWGGLGAVRGLLAEATMAIDVTLIEPNAAFMSCPLSAHYIAGWQPAQDLQRSYSGIDRLGVRRMARRVQAIERERRQVVLDDGQRIGYDYLVLSPGVEYMEEAIAGYTQARERLPVGFRAFEQEAVKREVDAFLAEGGDFVITVPKPPYRCPPAPYERACLIAEQLRRRGVKGRVVLLDANAAPTPAPIAKPLLQAMQQEYTGWIDYRPNVEVKAVDIGGARLQTSAGEVSFRRANLVLPMRAPALLRQAGLAERWAPVRLPSFQSMADERIFIVGDAQGSPLPKSGHVAFHAGRQVGETIAQTLAGRPPAPPTGGVDLPTGICWAAVTHDTAININVSARLEPGAAPQLKFTVDPEHNARSGKAAMAWGTGMWKAMLG